ncbi:MAG: hypothetical protein Tp1125DCM238401_6 [Prokaryotic dsDNA virus sp.]|nr:MAG: hypothetical protein Tp1125DCM238401_6 [Prokaryotic dsDNA virus sp.]
MNQRTTYREIAEHLTVVLGKRVSIQRVQQIEARALQKLMAALEDESWVQEALEGTVDARRP